ncbi:MAG: response regulator [Magnetococcales bacterium]|nr:response regulator [Magnetococcales bacterium]MBF0114005.1 response regulator [Magnetococcales bacterium]
MKQLLIIDDDAVIRQSLARVLERSGYQVHTASSGHQGLRICEEYAIDLVVTDIFMPDSDGFEVIMNLKQSHPRIKLITMSGGTRNSSDSAFYLETATDFGADHVLKKPFAHDEILVAVAALLSHTP